MPLQILGLKELLHALDASTYYPAFRRFWTRAALAVQATGRRRAPVDKGLLRNDVLYEIDPRDPALWAKVGSDLPYALPLDQPETRTPHYARGPFASEPTEGWLTGAPEESLPALESALEAFGDDIESLWEKA